MRLKLFKFYFINSKKLKASFFSVKTNQLNKFLIPSLVDFIDGAKVWWDGSTRAYIDAPPSYRGKTLGLCGTFNSNMKDDFLTPEGKLKLTIYFITLELFLSNFR
jgi:hypothetical protein